MFSYARELLTTRPALWAGAAGCAIGALLAPLLVATVLARPVTVLLLSGNPGVALGSLPPPFQSQPVAVGGGAMLVLVAALWWARFFTVMVWASDKRRDGGIVESWRQTRAIWVRTFTFYLSAYALLAILGAVLVLVTMLIARGAEGGVVAAAIMGTGILLVGRTVIRVLLTLAVRAALLGDARGFKAWRRSLEIARTQRREVLAAWLFLVAIGGSLWFGGRLVSPILQDTTLRFRSDSAHAIAREAAQLVLAGPIEAFLLALSCSIWTAVFLRAHQDHQFVPPVRRGLGPGAVKTLTGVVVVAAIANGVPALADVSWTEARRAERERIGRDAIDPDDALSRSSTPRIPAPTSYRVDARLEGDRLAWTTSIRYLNRTRADLATIALHVYPAAFARKLSEVPLARDLMTAGLAGLLRTEGRSGTLAVASVKVDGKSARYSRDETALEVRLHRPLAPRRRVQVEIELAARLPRFPERFGTWRDTTLLGNWVPVVAERSGGAWRLDPYGSIGDPFFASVADYVVEIDVDERHSVVGTGTLRAVEEHGGRRTWHFEADASRDFALALGPFLRGLERQVGGVMVRSWFPADNASHGAANLDSASSAVAHYTRIFGPLPYDEVDVILTDGFLGGMEYPGLVFVSRPFAQVAAVPLIPDLARYTGLDDAAARYIVGHEVAHQWWYAAVGNDQIREPWLDEGFAEASTRLWLRGSDGTEQAWRETNLVTEASPEPGVLGARLDDFATNQLYSSAVYLGGSEILLALRGELGRARFDRLMRRWYLENVLGIVTVDGFIDHVGEHGGPRARAFVERFR